jgi:glycosyltransferase involved in cell wall biosynthesis
MIINNPKLTVITVVLNGGEGFKETVFSVLEQSWTNFEYLIFDGGSTDGGPEWIQSIENKNIRFIKGKDKGIYDAMNQAIDLASGEWIYFLNAGDTFYLKNTLENIFQKLNSNTNLFSGFVQTKNDPTGVSIQAGVSLSLNEFYFKIPVSHQGLMCKKELFNSIGLFNLKYSVVADQEWLIRYFTSNNIKYQFISIPFAWYETVGFSHNNRKKAIKQCLNYSNLYFPKYIHLLNIIRYPFIYFKILLLSNLKDNSIYKAYRKLRFG